MQRGRQHVQFIHGRGDAVSLPEAATPTFTEIDPPGIAPVRFPKGSPYGILGRWDRYHVDMVGHQAIRPGPPPSKAPTTP